MFNNALSEGASALMASVDSGDDMPEPCGDIFYWVQI
jgi:hypothetical protein